MEQQEATHKSSPGGPFDELLLHAIAGQDHLFSTLSHSSIPDLTRELHRALDHEYPDSPKYSESHPVDSLISRCKYLSERGAKSPECFRTFLTSLSDDAQAFMEFLGEKYDTVRKFIFSETDEDQLLAEVVDVCAKSIALNPDKYDLAFIQKLLEAQTPCVVPESERLDPSRPVRSGILSPFGEQEFLDGLRADNAQLLVTKNAQAAYGWAMYHGTGSCAPGNREFVDRANRVLSSEAGQKMVQQVFGARYNPDSVATVDTALIDPLIDGDFEEGGAETNRGITFKALAYYILHELAVKGDRPEWVLAWVRTNPYPNMAIQVHQKVLFHDTGIELPFYPDDPAKPVDPAAPPDPNQMRLKLLLCHLPTHFDAEGNVRQDVNPDQKDDPFSYGSASLAQRNRMFAATKTVWLTDLDVRD